MNKSATCYLVVGRPSEYVLHDIREGFPSREDMRELARMLKLRTYANGSDLIEAFGDESFKANFANADGAIIGTVLEQVPAPAFDAEMAYWPI